MKKFDWKDGIRSPESFFLETDDIFEDLEEKKGTSLLLGKYSLQEVRAVLMKRNFFKDAQNRGLWPLDYDMDSSEFPPLQRFQIFFKEKKPPNLIVDLKIREGKFRPKTKIALEFGLPEFHFIILDWLTLQNPLLDFTSEKTPLPGQNHPGLNLGKKVLDLFDYLARLDNTDGLLAFPAYFHNALLFSRTFRFANPEKRGEVLAILRSFPELSFKQLSWVVYLNCLKDKNGQTYEWRAEEQVHPLARELKKYFESKAYKETVQKTRENLSFSIDMESFKSKVDDLGLHLF